MSIINRILGRSKKSASPVTFTVDPPTLAASKRVERGGHCCCLALRTKKGTPSVPNLHVEQQDASALGWQLICEQIVSESGSGVAVFEPSATVPADLWATVITLPPEIQSFPKLLQLRLYGSNLRMLPPEIGRLDALEDLDIYTSYSLHWLPYEVLRCAQLRQSRMSTRALYGNAKTRLPFPRISGPIDALLPKTCSVCDQPFGAQQPQVFWTTQRVGTDIAPLMIHSCSPECLAKVPDAPKGYHVRPHRGGGGVGMPDPEID
jgi:hypothetical protein